MDDSNGNGSERTPEEQKILDAWADEWNKEISEKEANLILAQVRRLSNIEDGVEDWVLP